MTRTSPRDLCFRLQAKLTTKLLKMEWEHKEVSSAAPTSSATVRGQFRSQGLATSPSFLCSGKVFGKRVAAMPTTKKMSTSAAPSCRKSVHSTPPQSCLAQVSGQARLVHSIPSRAQAPARGQLVSRQRASPTYDEGHWMLAGTRQGRTTRLRPRHRQIRLLRTRSSNLKTQSSKHQLGKARNS